MAIYARRPDTTHTGKGDATLKEPLIYFDRLNREVRTVAQAFDGRWVYKDTEYDGQGRVARASRPYFAGGAVY